MKNPFLKKETEVCCSEQGVLNVLNGLWITARLVSLFGEIVRLRCPHLRLMFNCVQNCFSFSPFLLLHLLLPLWSNCMTSHLLEFLRVCKSLWSCLFFRILLCLNVVHPFHRGFPILWYVPEVCLLQSLYLWLHLLCTDLRQSLLDCFSIIAWNFSLHFCFVSRIRGILFIVRTLFSK